MEEETIKGRIIELQDEVSLKADLVTLDDNRDMKKKSDQSPKNNSNEGQAKEEMEALAENEELIRDWLDDKM